MTSLLHIFTVADSFVFMRGQLAYMKERGYDIHGITSPGPLVDTVREREQIPIHTVEMPRQITPGQDLKALYQMVRLIREIKPDIVHAHTPKGGLLGMIAALIAGVDARIYHMRGLPLITATGHRKLLLNATERVSCTLAHRVITVGRSIRQTALEEALCTPRKIEVIGEGSSNGVDARGLFNPAGLPDDARAATRRRYGIPDDATVIGFVGRLVRDKGILELAEAWARLREAHPDGHLLLVGPFEERDAVPDQVRRQLIDDPRIHLPGYVTDTPAHYAAMDIYTLPTHREGFPNSPLEAAAMELPVVASSIGPCQEAVAEGETGAIVPVKDAAALAQALERYIDDPELRRRHGKAGRARVLEEFRPEQIWEGIAEVYESLTA